MKFWVSEFCRQPSDQGELTASAGFLRAGSTDGGRAAVALLHSDPLLAPPP